MLLGLAAGDALAGTAALAAVLGGLARFGTTSLPALGGAQAVLGPAAAVSPAVGALASALAALALVVVAPSRSLGEWRGWLFGLLAGLVALGPSVTSASTLAVRAGGAALGVGLVAAGQRWWPAADRPVWLPWAGLGLAAVALALAVAA